MGRSRRLLSREDGFTLIEAMVGMVLLAIAAVYGASLLNNLNKGTQGTQNKADFIQLQGLGMSLIMGNPHDFCSKAGILGLSLPSAQALSGYLSASSSSASQASPPPLPDLMNPACVRFPFPAQSGSVTFAANGQELLSALSAPGPRSSPAPGAGVGGCTLAPSPSPAPAASPGAQANSTVTVPFSLVMSRTAGGNLSRDFSLNLSVDQSGVIRDCLSSGAPVAGAGVYQNQNQNGLVQSYQSGDMPITGLWGPPYSMSVPNPFPGTVPMSVTWSLVAKVANNGYGANDELYVQNYAGNGMYYFTVANASTIFLKLDAGTTNYMWLPQKDTTGLFVPDPSQWVIHMTVLSHVQP